VLGIGGNAGLLDFENRLRDSEESEALNFFADERMLGVVERDWVFGGSLEAEDKGRLGVNGAGRLDLMLAVEDKDMLGSGFDGRRGLWFNIPTVRIELALRAVVT
jgi:hypothetical protein